MAAKPNQQELLITGRIQRRTKNSPHGKEKS